MPRCCQALGFKPRGEHQCPSAPAPSTRGRSGDTARRVCPALRWRQGTRSKQSVQGTPARPQRLRSPRTRGAGLPRGHPGAAAPAPLSLAAELRPSGAGQGQSRGRSGQVRGTALPFSAPAPARDAPAPLTPLRSAPLLLPRAPAQSGSRAPLPRSAGGPSLRTQRSLCCPDGTGRAVPGRGWTLGSGLDPLAGCRQPRCSPAASEAAPSAARVRAGRQLRD